MSMDGIASGRVVYRSALGGRIRYMDKGYSELNKLKVLVNKGLFE